MSRIHDALKKAEEERQGTARSQLVTGTLEKPAPVAPKTEVASSAATDGRAAVATLATGGAPELLTVEALQTRIPILKWTPDPKRIVAYHNSDANLGTEEFRSLRSRLYQCRDAGPLRRVLVTSALPQEGKTYVAANLAHSIVRQRERRAILIDADLRWSRLHTLLGTNLSPGLTNYLRGETDELSIIQRGTLENLFLIPGGKSASNASELIANGRLKTLLDRLTPLFDWIIIDSPPAIAMSDASLLAEFCDGVLLVVASGKTPFDMAQKTREQFKKARLLGVVLNRAEPQTTGSHFYYGYYQGGEKSKKARG